MSAADRPKWVRVKKGSPCRFCQKDDERCAVSSDGRFAVCYRVGDGAAREKSDKNGNTYWVHRLTPDPQPESRRRRKRTASTSGPEPQRADADKLHEVYSALLTIGNFALTTEDRAELARRGFPEGEPERRAYHSHAEDHRWAITEDLTKRFGRDVVLSVPGFVLSDRGVLTLAGGAGLLIPARDVEGRIVALCLRPRKRADGQGKYYWITSKATEHRKWDGPSPGAPVHVPLGIERPAKVVRVTEGVLKADLAQVLSGLPTIGIPGVGNWKGALRVLKALGAETVRVAYDADLRSNPKVARALHNLVEGLRAAEFAVEVEWWELADGKGIDDLLAAGKTPEVLTGHEVEALVQEIRQDLSAAQPKARGGRRGGDDDEEKETQAEILLRLAAVATLFHSADMRTFASVPVGGHVEHHPIRSTSFRRWLTHAFYEDQGKPPSSEALLGALNVLEANAQYDGPQEQVFVRVAGTGDAGNPTIYLDLCDDQWRAVEVTRDGWRVVDQPPVKFRRAKGMLALPEPEPGGTLADLRTFLNLGSDEDWMLWVGCVTAATRPSGPYPIQAYNGEQGSAKSTTSRIARRLVDPHVTMLRSEPREVRDLMIAAHNAWCVALDNLSGIPVWLSDALCRLATGGGFGTRELYANEEETFFDALRPVILNGIEEYASRGDLIDRCVFFHLPRIPEERRREEAPFWREFEAALPKLFGALLDAVTGGLRELPEVRLDRLPRMADFARWGEAVGRALGWGPGAFLRAYAGNRASACDLALEDSPVAVAVRTLMEADQEWEGTATDLLARLGEIAGEKAVGSKRWPRSPRGLSGQLRRVAPALRTVGVDVDFDRREPGGNRTRLISITKTEEQEREGPGPSRSSRPSQDGAAAAVSEEPTSYLRNGDVRDGRRDANEAEGRSTVPTVPPTVPPPGPPENGLKPFASINLRGDELEGRDGRDDRDGCAPLSLAPRGVGREVFDL